MNRLSKKDEARKDDLVAQLVEAQAKVEDAVSQYNAEITAAALKLAGVVNDYNEWVSQAEEFRSDIAGEQDEYYDGKSEKWQEGEKGTAYGEWKQEWADALEPVEIDEPEELDCPEMNHADYLTGARNGPDDVA